MAERGRPMQPLVLDRQDRSVLERLTNRRKTAQALALRARIVLGCAEEITNGEVAERLGVTRTTVGKWRRRFIEAGLDGLFDEDRPGAPRTVSDDMVERVVIKTLEEQSADAPHWSTRSMAKATGMSPTTIRRIWQPLSSSRLWPRASSCPPIRCSSRSCAMWWACIWTRPSGRLCFASMRRARSRRSTASSLSCR